MKKMNAGEFVFDTKDGNSITVTKNERSITLRNYRVLSASVFAVLAAFLLLPAAAHATDVTVVCPSGAVGAFSSINAALAALPQNGPNTITVTGMCNEDVSITDMRSLTIIAGAGGAKILQPQDSNTFDIVRSQNITLKGLEIAGVPGSTLGSGGFGVSISENSDVHILGCDIHGNEGGGVIAINNSVLFLRSTNIHDNTPSDGLDVTGSSTADVRLTTIQNNGCSGLVACFNFGYGGGVGVFVAQSSIVVFHQNNLVQNNGDIGIWARVLGSVAFGNGPTQATTIQGHNIIGILIQEGAHLQFNAATLIQGNGGGCPPESPIPCGGIFATGNSTVESQGSPTISGNHGTGIRVEQGTNLHLGGGVSVSNNSGDGVDIRRISIGDFTAIPGSGNANNTITGNGGASVFCDARSLAIGNLSTFSNVRCPQQ